MLLYLFDFRKVFFEGASKSSTAFFTVFALYSPSPSQILSAPLFYSPLLLVLSTLPPLLSFTPPSPSPFVTILILSFHSSSQPPFYFCLPCCSVFTLTCYFSALSLLRSSLPSLPLVALVYPSLLSSVRRGRTPIFLRRAEHRSFRDKKNESKEKKKKGRRKERQEKVEDQESYEKYRRRRASRRGEKRKAKRRRH
jgi:hypothetical protein